MHDSQEVASNVQVPLYCPQLQHKSVVHIFDDDDEAKSSGGFMDISTTEHEVVRDSTTVEEEPRMLEMLYLRRSLIMGKSQLYQNVMKCLLFMRPLQGDILVEVIVLRHLLVYKLGKCNSLSLSLSL